MAEPIEHHDIIILGAGLSGINTAHVLGESLPHRPFTILEARPIVGGTWSFFKYPGFRSDSYMTSFGLKWHPWKHRHKMASAEEIVEYIEEAAQKEGLREKIRFQHKVVGCEWRTDEQQWRLDVDVQGKRKIFAANFVISCLGYYSYDKAFQTTIPEIEKFGGQVVHPQWWPEDLDYSDKRIVIIGSGATAITIVPSLVEKAAMVTQLQRSPSFVVSRITHSSIDTFIRMILPLAWAHWVLWWKDTMWEVAITQFLLKFPNAGRSAITKLTKEAVPKDVDVDVHFNPSYNPFQQRLCMCPDGDYFKALHQDNCEIVTDVIDTVTEDGILLKSGKKLPADIIVTATGLYVQLFGGVIPTVDGQPIDPGSHYAWRGCMLDSLPNIAFMMGYITTSWTPGVDLMAKTVMRVLKHMEKTGSTSVMPVFENTDRKSARLAVSATSSYLVKAADRIPKVTGQGVWYGRTNLAVDAWAWMFGSVTEGLLYGQSGRKKDD
ncbi:Fc.00g019760.m01.CDS01 [Cosmosporella sp. VM-42]